MRLNEKGWDIITTKIILYKKRLLLQYSHFFLYTVLNKFIRLALSVRFMLQLPFISNYFYYSHIFFNASVMVNRPFCTSALIKMTFLMLYIIAIIHEFENSVLNKRRKIVNYFINMQCINIFEQKK